MTTVSKLQKACDKKYQQKYVAENPYCLMCGAPTFCIHHYILKARSNNLRYDKDNGVPVCKSCHFKFHNKDCAKIINDLILLKGQAWADDLYQRQHEFFKMNKTNLEKVLAEL